MPSSSSNTVDVTTTQALDNTHIDAFITMESSETLAAAASAARIRNLTTSHLNTEYRFVHPSRVQMIADSMAADLTNRIAQQTSATRNSATSRQTEYRWMHPARVQMIVGSMAVAPTESHKKQTGAFPPNSHMSFYKLSAELRNKIYEMALADHSEDGNGKITIQQARGMKTKHVRPIGRFAKVPALLQTSRQVRQEARGLYLASSTFIIKVPKGEDLDVAKGWVLSLQPADRSQIKHLELEFYEEEMQFFKSLTWVFAAIKATRRDASMPQAQKNEAKKLYNITASTIEYLASIGLDLEDVPKSAIVIKHWTWPEGAKEQQLAIISPELKLCGCGMISEFAEGSCVHPRGEDRS